MSFNSLMALLVQSTLRHLPADPTVIELGNQTLRADDRSLRTVEERCRNLEQVDHAGLKELIAQSSGNRGERAADFYRLLGFREYVAIDVNDRFGSLVMDLNEDLAESQGYRETFSLVTNNGTGEHVFNQDTIYRNVHNLTMPDGLMLHVMPFFQHVNHGFFTIQPNLYHALARANEYQLLSIGVATRNGVGIIAHPDVESGSDAALLRESIVPLGLLLSEAKPRRPGVTGIIKRFAGKPEARRFGRLLRRLQRDNPRLLCFSLMRKRKDATFARPIQGIYEEDVDAALRSEYDYAARS